MKKTLILGAFITVGLGAISCSNEDINKVNNEQAELQAIDKGTIETPGDRK